MRRDVTPWCAPCHITHRSRQQSTTLCLSSNAGMKVVVVVGGDNWTNLASPWLVHPGDVPSLHGLIITAPSRGRREDRGSSRKPCSMDRWSVWSRPDMAHTCVSDYRPALPPLPPHWNAQFLVVPGGRMCVRLEGTKQCVARRINYLLMCAHL